MARIRTIKPEFWTNEKVLTVKPLTRLLFIGMWNFADDYGRMQFAPLGIKAKVFPNDDISVADIRDMLNELCSADLLLIYSAEGKEYIEITGWDHQKIDRRQDSRIPAPFATGSVVFPPTSRRLPPIPAPVMEGKGEEGKEDIPTVAKATRRDERFQEFWKVYPKRDGANPKEPAAQLFAAAVKTGEDPQAIIDGARECASVESKNVGTPYIPQAVKWLRDKRWQDYQPRPIEPAEPVNWDSICQLWKKNRIWSKHAPGSDPDSPACQCPPEILAKHGIQRVSAHDPPSAAPRLRSMN